MCWISYLHLDRLVVRFSTACVFEGLQGTGQQIEFLLNLDP